MSRRSNGEGSVVKRKDGRWQGSLEVGGRRRYVYGRTRPQVIEALHKLTEQARQSGRLSTNPTLTVEAFLNEWLEGAKARLRATTTSDYSIMLRLHIAPVLGQTKLTRLSALQLVHFYAALSQKLSSRRVRMVHDFLHKALGDAVRWGLMANNPAAIVNAPKRENKEPALWTPGQVQGFLSAI